jgi:hypothetical protein
MEGKKVNRLWGKEGGNGNRNRKETNEWKTKNKNVTHIFREK